MMTEQKGKIFKVVIWDKDKKNPRGVDVPSDDFELMERVIEGYEEVYVDVYPWESATVGKLALVYQDKTFKLLRVPERGFGKEVEIIGRVVSINSFRKH